MLMLASHGPVGTTPRAQARRSGPASTTLSRTAKSLQRHSWARPSSRSVSTARALPQASSAASSRLASVRGAPAGQDPSSCADRRGALNACPPARDRQASQPWSAKRRGGRSSGPFATRFRCAFAKQTGGQRRAAADTADTVAPRRARRGACALQWTRDLYARWTRPPTPLQDMVLDSSLEQRLSSIAWTTINARKHRCGLDAATLAVRAGPHAESLTPA